MLFHHFQLFLQTHSEDAFCSTPNPPKSTTTKISSFVTSTFPPERCRKSKVWPAHVAWESFFFLLPMQHGKAKTHFCDTSFGNVLLFISVTRPQREAWKWRRCRFWIIASTSCVNFSPFPIIIFQPIPIIKKMKLFFYFLKLNFWQNYKILLFLFLRKHFYIKTENKRMQSVNLC